MRCPGLDARAVDFELLAGGLDETAVARQQAKAATEAAAREAAASVKDANRLDIDIQLVGPTSVKIAGKR